MRKIASFHIGKPNDSVKLILYQTPRLFIVSNDLGLNFIINKMLIYYRIHFLINASIYFLKYYLSLFHYV